MKIQPGRTLSILCLCANLSLACLYGQLNAGNNGPAGINNNAGLAAFDASRDPAVDLKSARQIAREARKRILLDVGGDWCAWCHALDQLFTDHPDLSQLRDTSYVTLKVYYGSDNRNEAFFRQYPKIAGIPHIFVLDPDGSVIASQHVIDLQSDGVYSVAKVKEFLDRWSSRSLPTASGAPSVTAAGK